MRGPTAGKMLFRMAPGVTLHPLVLFLRCGGHCDGWLCHCQGHSAARRAPPLEPSIMTSVGESPWWGAGSYRTRQTLATIGDEIIQRFTRPTDCEVETMRGRTPTERWDHSTPVRTRFGLLAQSPHERVWPSSNSTGVDTSGECWTGGAERS